eukprot:901005-Pleurochrysis_carterae.AAC.1
MMLIAVARPNGRHKFNGKIGCWRVTGDKIYKRRTVVNGITYEAGDSRRVDVNMDAAKFADMATELVFPAIRAKLPHAARVRV